MFSSFRFMTTGQLMKQNWTNRNITGAMILKTIMCRKDPILLILMIQRQELQN